MKMWSGSEVHDPCSRRRLASAWRAATLLSMASDGPRTQCFYDASRRRHRPPLGRCRDRRSAAPLGSHRCHPGTKPSHRPTTVTAMSRVLIVEDEDDIAELLRFSLKLDGHDPLVAMTGEDALSQIERLRPDLVLLDPMLPDLPGTEICRRLKSGPRDRQIPVIIVTAR